MSQNCYCRYCNNLIAGDTIYCIVKEKEISYDRAKAKWKKPCKDFEFNKNDALKENLKGYRPQEISRGARNVLKEARSGMDGHKGPSENRAIPAGFITKGSMKREVKKKFKIGDKIQLNINVYQVDDSKKSKKCVGRIIDIQEDFTVVQLKNYKYCPSNHEMLADQRIKKVG